MKTFNFFKYPKYLYFIPILLIGIYFVFKIPTYPVGDFGNYFYASKFFTMGKWGLWIYEPIEFNLAIYNLGQRDFFLNYTPVPPLSVLLYLPFSYLNIIHAKIIWSILNIILFAVSIYRLQIHYKFDNRFVLIIPFLFFTPIRNILYDGQSYFLLFFLLSEGLIQYSNKSFWITAILWSLAIHLKVSPLFVLFFLLFNKDYLTAFKTTGFTFLLVLLSTPLIGFDIWKHYIFDIIPRLFAGEINNPYAINYQSFQVLMKIVFVPDLLNNSFPIFNNINLYSQLTLFFNGLIFMLAMACSFTKTNQHLKFSLWLIMSFLTSGYGNSFSIILLAIPAILFFESKTIQSKELLGLLLIGLIANMPYQWFSTLPVAFQFPRLLLLLLLFVILIIKSKPKLKAYYVLPFFVFFIPFNQSNATQNYLLKKEEALLIYNFEIQENKLTYHYFDQKGLQQKILELPFKVKSITKLNDDFGLKQKRENIRKRYLINQNILIYLSDKNRGIGFYTLMIDDANPLSNLHDK